MLYSNCKFALYSMQALSVQTVRYDLAECLLYCNCTQIVQKQPNFAIFAANKQFWRG